MAEVRSHTPGTPCWMELASPYPEYSRAFYETLFGWSIVANRWPGTPYQILQMGERDAAGLYEMTAEQKGQGIPAYWLPYFAVINVDESQRKAAYLGAQLLTGVYSLGDGARVAQFQDPTGALFGLWESRGHSGAQWIQEHGGLAWVELCSSAPSVAARFYGQLLGWDGEDKSTRVGTWYTFNLGRKPVAGLSELPETWVGVPSHWSVFVGVSDVEGAVGTVQSAGGRLVIPPRPYGKGSAALCVDPFGAAFSIVRFRA